MGPSIPQEDQLNAMVEGSVYELARKYVQNPSRYDLKRYLNVNRRQLIDFLIANPSRTQTSLTSKSLIQRGTMRRQCGKKGTSIV